MDVMVVGRAAQQRWALAAQLGLDAAAACPQELAASRLAHPASQAPDAVVLVVEDRHDVAWLRAHVARSPRRWVPVVAVVHDDALVEVVERAGARAAMAARTAPIALLRALREVTRPANVVELDPSRTA